MSWARIERSLRLNVGKKRKRPKKRQTVAKQHLLAKPILAINVGLKHEMADRLQHNLDKD